MWLCSYAIVRMSNTLESPKYIYTYVCIVYIPMCVLGCIQRKTIKSIDCTNSEDIEKSSYRPLLEGQPSIKFIQLHAI